MFPCFSLSVPVQSIAWNDSSRYVSSETSVNPTHSLTIMHTYPNREVGHKLGSLLTVADATEMKHVTACKINEHCHSHILVLRMTSCRCSWALLTLLPHYCSLLDMFESDIYIRGVTQVINGQAPQSTEAVSTDTTVCRHRLLLLLLLLLLTSNAAKRLMTIERQWAEIARSAE